VALWWSKQIVSAKISPKSQSGLTITSLLSILLFLALAVVTFYSPQWLGDDPSMPNLGLRVSEAGLSRVGAIIWGISAIAGVILLLRRQAHWLWGVKFLGFVAFLMFVIMPASAIIDTERQLPLRQISQSVVQVENRGEEVVMITEGFEKPSLVFYTQQPITFLHEPSKAISHIQNAANESSSESVLIIATPDSLEETGLSPNQYQEITAQGIYQLVRVPTSGVR
jgi:hypothetical protein